MGGTWVVIELTVVVVVVLDDEEDITGALGELVGVVKDEK